MRIIERYPWYYSLLKGEGLWALLTPLRFFVSLLYGLHIRQNKGEVRKRADGDRQESDRSSATASPASGRATITTIGNIEAGGLGKTPITLEIAGGLLSLGEKVVVVTRGYRSLAESSGRTVILFPEAQAELVSAGRYIDARSMLGELNEGGDTASKELSAVVGDEALLYVDRNIPVVIDKNRVRGIEIALEVFSPSHILLDDAYQRTDVRADRRILLLDAQRPFGNGHLLPMGTLREKPSSVSRADTVIFTRCTSHDTSNVPDNMLLNKEIYYSRHVGAGLFDRDGTRIMPTELAGKEFILFSGIARPESFERTVIEAGLDPFLAFRFIDHHSYTERDLDDILENAPEGAVYITTEKDIGKVRGKFPKEARLLYLKLSVKIDRLDDLIASIRHVD